jgi:hypothetical protein
MKLRLLMILAAWVAAMIAGNHSDIQQSRGTIEMEQQR